MESGSEYIHIPRSDPSYAYDCASGSHRPLSTLSSVGKQRIFQVTHTSSHNHSRGSVLDGFALFGWWVFMSKLSLSCQFEVRIG